MKFEAKYSFYENDGEGEERERGGRGRGEGKGGKESVREE